MIRTNTLARAFAAIASAVTLSASALMLSSSNAYADDESCGENSGPQCQHDTWCADRDAAVNCTHTPEPWKYYPVI
jgi:hypothetical protein